MGRKRIVTAALPYSNGDIHLGHVLEHVELDIWVRARRMAGEEIYAFCADDSHGVPIMMGAKNRGISPEELIANMREKHLEDLTAFEIHYDHYSSTHTETNREICYELFEEMKRGGHLKQKEVQQFFCVHCSMFLPDRFVKGQCPRCHSEDQYGDSCDNCGASYSTDELIGPYCSTCGRPPTKKKSQHLFFQLESFREFLREWIKTSNSPAMINKLNEWLSGELRDWNISRDEPYFGFEIPGYPGKYFYVWVDAPVGYISTVREWAQSRGESLEDYWCNEETKIVHFIGKDINYFHSLFWPSMLKNSRYQLPSRIFTHGFLTVNGVKMSKSKGTFVLAKDYLKEIDPAYFRYYLASKLSGSVDDFDLNTTDFVGRVNSELIGKITNIISRGAQMLEKNFGGVPSCPDEALENVRKDFEEKSSLVQGLYEERQYHRVVSEVREMADRVNALFEERKPWVTLKENPEATHRFITSILLLFRIIAIYIAPILPSYTKRVLELFGENHWTFDSVRDRTLHQTLKPYQAILMRVDKAAIEALFGLK